MAFCTLPMLGGLGGLSWRVLRKNSPACSAVAEAGRRRKHRGHPHLRRQHKSSGIDRERVNAPQRDMLQSVSRHAAWQRGPIESTTLTNNLAARIDLCGLVQWLLCVCVCVCFRAWGFSICSRRSSDSCWGVNGVQLQHDHLK